MNIEAGDIIKGTIERKTDLGYTVRVEEEEMFLHNNEVVGDVEEGDEVEAFVYVDSKERLTLTMQIPTVREEEFHWVKVVGVNPRLGVFVDIGIAKDLLIPREEMPRLDEAWPVEGDFLYIRMKKTNKGRILGKPAPLNVFQDMAKPAARFSKNQNVQGRIVKGTKVGSYIFTTEHYFGFIHESERGAREPRLGELVNGRIIDIKELGRVNISLMPRKQEVLDEDATKIMSYLEERGGHMPYGDKTQPDIIEQVFGMSKGAFKRALGRLMKQGLISQDNGWTELKK